MPCYDRNDRTCYPGSVISQTAVFIEDDENKRLLVRNEYVKYQWESQWYKLHRVLGEVRGRQVKP